MLTTEQINDLHRLYWSDHWPIRKIERHLHMGWDTIKKYLDMPAQTPAGRPRSSKLDPYKATIAELLEKDPSASAAVIGQRLCPLGYTGGGSILRQYVHEVRPQLKPQRAFVRNQSRANASRPTGVTSNRSTTKAISGSSTPSPWWTGTAGCSIWSSRTARVSRPLSVVTFTHFRS
jgi:hypothetical protein